MNSRSSPGIYNVYIYIYDISGSISRSCTPNFWQELAPGSEGARWWQAPCHPESGQRAGG